MSPFVVGCNITQNIIMYASSSHVVLDILMIFNCYRLCIFRVSYGLSLPAGMSTNCSNASSLSPASYGILLTLLEKCFRATNLTFSLAAYPVCNVIVLLPLYIYILYLGLQRCCRQQSATLISHSDAVTYHLIIIELLNMFGSTLVWFGTYSTNANIIYFGLHLSLLNLSGENAFHFIACMERYIAVTYPIAYLNLRNERGIRIRNVVIGCAWLFSLGCLSVLHLDIRHTGIIVYFLCTGIMLGILSLFSLNVLCVLILPQKRGEHRQHIGQSKLRAVYTITLILVALMFRCVGFVISLLVFTPKAKSCTLLKSALWLSLPSKLVLPLLYLQRAGKMPDFKCNN